MNEEHFEAMLKAIPDEELSQLSDERIETLTELQAVHDGVQFCSMPPALETLAKPEPHDATMYQVKGIDYYTREAAQAVCDVLNAQGANVVETDYDSQIGYGGDGKMLVPQDQKDDDPETYSVKEVTIFSKHRFMGNKAILMKRKALKEPYDQAVRRYESMESSLGRIRKKLIEERQKAMCRLKFRADLTEQMARYMRVAEGDVDKATEFYVMANGEITEEQWKFMLPDVPYNEAWAKERPEPVEETDDEGDEIDAGYC